MYEVKEYNDRQFKAYELLDKDGKSSFKVIPERGGIITSFKVNGNEVFYLEEETLYDTSKNVKGGNPILFPTSGVVENGEYELNGKKYKMDNHGFARNYPWQVIETGTENGAYIKISFKSNELTKERYPFDFEIVYTYILKGNTLTIEQEYKNNSGTDMPMYPGFHPYFNILDKANLKYDIDTTSYIEFGGTDVKKYNGGIDLTNETIAKLLLDVKKNEISFYDDKLNRKIVMEYSKEFKNVVLWSVPGQNFVCVEPWIGRPNSMNTGEDLYLLKPNGVFKAYLSIKCE